MPRASVWLLRTALLQTGLGFLLGGLLLANKGLYYGLPSGKLLPAHLECLLIGGMVQLAMGMGYWIFPRFRTGDQRGASPLVWAAWGMLNAGVIGVALSPLGARPAAPAAGRALELLAALTYGAAVWRRIKGFGVP